MSGYDEIEIESASDYIKLKAGEVVTLHLLSKTPTKEVIHWINKEKIVCGGKGCDNCASGLKPKQRWTADAWDRKEGKVKKFEFGPMIAGQLKEISELLRESQKDIHSVDLRIKTTGSGMDTEYRVDQVPMNGEIPLETLKMYDEVGF